MLNCDDISKCVDGKKFTIINVTKSNNYQFFDDGKMNEDMEDYMDKFEIGKFFDELEKIISDNNNLCFIIFNEFFFSYHLIIKETNYNLIMERSFQITEKKPNIILFINLCHEIQPELITKEYTDKLQVYYNKIYDNDNNEIWDISSLSKDKIFKNKNNNYFANETFVIMRGSILYTYKKSTYFFEIYNTVYYNYVIGFGTDEINKNLNGELSRISEYLSRIISIEICYDFQKNIKIKTFENAIFKGDNNEIKEIKELRKNVKNYSEKKIIIIQSNTMDIYKQIDVFPLNKIICKSDPIQHFVFVLKDKNKIDEIKYTEEFNFDLINKEKKIGNKIENKEKRLDNNLFELNRKCEYHNVIKLINEFKAKKTVVKIEDNQFMFFEYNDLNK